MYPSNQTDLATAMLLLINALSGTPTSRAPMMQQTVQMQLSPAHCQNEIESENDACQIRILGFERAPFVVLGASNVHTGRRLPIKGIRTEVHDKPEITIRRVKEIDGGILANMQILSSVDVRSAKPQLSTRPQWMMSELVQK